MSPAGTGATTTFLSHRDGFAVYGLRSGEVELAVIPELGANLIRLRSVRSGREWMWRRPDGVGLFPNARGDAFERSPLTGAVECLPTIAACIVAGREIPDHGETWAAPWDLNQDAFLDGALHTSLRLPACGLEFSRCIRLDGRVARFEYRLVNRSQKVTPYLWAFHPLLGVEPDDRLELPESIHELRMGVSEGFPGIADAAFWNWPEPSPGIQLDRVASGLPAKSFAKLFADFRSCGAGWAALRRGAERLEFRFDPKEIPYLGLWFTAGGWHGFTHIAIEPTSDMTDSLAESGGNSLAPMGERCWWFEIVLSSVLSSKECRCVPHKSSE